MLGKNRVTSIIKNSSISDKRVVNDEKERRIIDEAETMLFWNRKMEIRNRMKNTEKNGNKIDIR
jgi:hypothetical protein